MIITLHCEGEQPAAKQKERSDDIRLASVEELLLTSATVVDGATAESKVLGAGLEQLIPKFSDCEISSGGIIGRGGFCLVRDIDRIRVGGVSRSNSLKSNRTSRTAGDAAANNGTKNFGEFFFLCFKRDSDDMSYSVKSLDSSVHSGPDGKPVTETKCKYTREYVARHSKKTRKNGGRYVLKSVNKGVDKITLMKGNVDIAM